MESNNPLSFTEIKVLNLVKEGLRNRQIAETLDRSVKTIENHVRSILLKLEVKTRTQAVVEALKRGIISVTTGGSITL